MTSLNSSLQQFSSTNSIFFSQKTVWRFPSQKHYFQKNLFASMEEKLMIVKVQSEFICCAKQIFFRKVYSQTHVVGGVSPVYWFKETFFPCLSFETHCWTVVLLLELCAATRNNTEGAKHTFSLCFGYFSPKNLSGSLLMFTRLL